MDIILSQGANGSWKLNRVKHSGPGDLVISNATLTLSGKSLSITNITNQASSNAISTPWSTPIISGVGVDLNYSILNEKAQPKEIRKGKTVYKINYNFTGRPYRADPEPEVRYQLRVEPSSQSISSAGTGEFKVKLVSTPGGEEDVATTSSWSIISGSEYAKINKGGSAKIIVTGANETDASQTVTIRVKHTAPDGTALQTDVTVTVAPGESITPPEPPRPELTITYTGTGVTAEAGVTGDFNVTYKNVTITGYSVDNEDAKIQLWSGPSVFVEYPANSAGTTYTVTVKGLDTDGNEVTASTTFNQGGEDYTLTLTPATIAVNYDVTSYRFTVTYNKVSNIGYDGTSSILVTGHTISLPDATAKFSENSSTTETRQITFVITAKTSLGTVVSAQSIVTQSTKQAETDSITFITGALANVPCDSSEIFRLEISANTDWEVSSSSQPDWIQVVSLGQNYVEIALSRNETSSDRSGNVTVRAKNNASVSASLQVTQKKCEGAGTIQVTPSNVTLECDDTSTHTVSVNATGTNWMLEVIDTNWIEVIDTMNNSITFVASANPGDERVCTIIVKPDPPSYTEPAYLTITQKKCVVEGIISASTTAASFECKNAGTQVITVAANVDWTAETSAQWITILTQNSNSIVYSISDNSGDDRSGTITLRPVTAGEASPVIITITQASCPEPGYITPSSYNEEFECDYPYARLIYVEANVAWSARTSNPEWIYIVNLQNGSFDIEVEENEGNDRHGTITLFSVEPDAAPSVNISITQLKCAEPGSISVNPVEVYFECSSEGPTRWIQVTSNVQWTAETNSSWIRVFDIESSGFKVNVNDNEGNVRFGYVTVRPINQGEAEPVQLYVEQEKCPAPKDLSVVPVQLNFQCENNHNETVTVSTTGGVEWTASTENQWITIGNISQTGFTVSVSDNDGDTRTGTITVSPTNTQEVNDVVITVEQLRCQTVPTITIEPDTTVLNLSGGTVHAIITATNGEFSDLTISQNSATYVVTTAWTEGNQEITEVDIIFDQVQNPTSYTVAAYGENQYGETCRASVEIEMVRSPWILSDVDYILFTYEWTDNDGTDLDSFTYIDGVPRNSILYNKGIGFANGQSAPVSPEKYVGTNYNDAILRFAGDNMQTGGEYTLVNLSKLNEYITSLGMQQENTKLIIYLTGNWYSVKRNGNADIAFSAYTGGHMDWVQIQGTSNYKYEPSSDSVLKDSRKETGINVFGYSHRSGSVQNVGAHAIENHSFPLTSYTTMAALVYDLETGVFYLAVGDDLKGGMFAERYQYGLDAFCQGNYVITDENDTVLDDKHFMAGTTTVKPSVDLTTRREYTVTLSGDFVGITGSTPQIEYRSPLLIKPDTCQPEYIYSSVTFDPMENDPTKFKVTFTESGQPYLDPERPNKTWYRVNFELQNPNNDRFMNLFLGQHRNTSLDIDEQSQ